MSLSSIISDSKDNVSYSQVLANRAKSQSERLNTREESWVHFLRDNLSYLKSKSPKIHISDDDLSRYRYRLREWLYEKNHYATRLELAFILLNDLKNLEDFSLGLGEVYFPHLGTLESLYRVYVNIEHKKRSTFKYD